MYSAALPRQFCKRPLPSVTTGLCWAGGRARHPPSSAVSRSFATKSSLASAAAAVAVWRDWGSCSGRGRAGQWPTLPQCGECYQQQEEVVEEEKATMARQVSRCPVSSLVVVLWSPSVLWQQAASPLPGAGARQMISADYCHHQPPAPAAEVNVFSSGLSSLVLL